MRSYDAESISENEETAGGKALAVTGVNKKGVVSLLILEHR